MDIYRVFIISEDIELFKFLEEDIASGRMKYTSAKSLKTLYTKLTGKTSNVHKYYVLRWDEPSNLIPAHLFKDGLRLFIQIQSKHDKPLCVRKQTSNIS